MPAESSAPGATYRVQLWAGFGFDDVAGIVPYLADLGVTHLYASPYLQAAPGSTHGYDVVDHRQVNAELGGNEGHARMCSALSESGLGQILDIVPNHMAIGTRENAWWWDVLENGPSSRYASYFDVDWDPPESKLRNIVLIPVLEDHYGRVLEDGKIRVARRGGTFVVRYEDHVSELRLRRVPVHVEVGGVPAGWAVLQDVTPPRVLRTGDGHVIRHRVEEVTEAVVGKRVDHLTVPTVSAERGVDAAVIDHVIAMRAALGRLQIRRGVEVGHPEVGEVARQGARVVEAELD